MRRSWPILTLVLTSDGTQDSSYVNPLVVDRLLVNMPFLVAGIAVRPSLRST